jgi:HAD superfamily hydrolase (TIGR01509 family)
VRRSIGKAVDGRVASLRDDALACESRADVARPFDLVIFDCDGVLVDSERIVSDAESAFFTGLGLAMDAATTRALFKGRTVAEIAALVERRAAGGLPADWVYDWGVATGAALARRLRAVVGVRTVLERLHAAGVATCVASQSPRARVELSLALTGLADLVGARAYCASMVPRGKPAPDLFLHAAGACGAAPDRCAVVEDSASGVVAARAAGMAAFGYAADEDGDGLARAGAVVFTTMKALPALLGIAPAA